MKHRRIAKIATKREKELLEIIQKEKSPKQLSKAMRTSAEFGNIDVRITDSFYNPLSYSGNELSSDIYNYIEEKTNLIPAIIPVNVTFHGNVSEAEQENIRQAIYDHYQANMQDIIWDNRANNTHFTRMLIIGVIFIVIYVILAVSRQDSLFLEVLSVIGSFSLWEAADCYFVERPNIQQELLGAAQLLSMEINFKED